MDHSYNPGSKSQGGFSEVSIDPRYPTEIRKRVLDLWTMEPRYTSNYTEKEFALFVEEIMDVLQQPQYGLLNFLPPEISTSWNPNLLSSRGSIHMTRIEGTDLEHMQQISVPQARQLDHLLSAAVRIDVRTKDLYADRQMRVRPDIIQQDETGKPYFHSIMYGTPAGADDPATSSALPQWYLIDTYPAYYFTQFDSDYTQQHWMAALQDLSKRSGNYGYPLLNSALVELQKSKPEPQRTVARTGTR